MTVLYIITKVIRFWVKPDFTVFTHRTYIRRTGLNSISLRMDLFKAAVYTIVDWQPALLNQNLLEARPINAAFELVAYWHDSTARYPRLANATLTFLCLATGSCDMARTFSLPTETRSTIGQALKGDRHVAHEHNKMFQLTHGTYYWKACCT